MKHILFILILLLAFISLFTPSFAQELPDVAETNAPAHFPGGAEVFRKYLRDTLEYPVEALDNAMEGTVLARFSVSKNGQISNVCILKDFGFGCDEAVKRALEAMPDWIPAIKDGQTTDTFVVVPVQFRLTEF